MLKIAAVLLFSAFPSVASAQSSTTNCSRDMWGNTTCNTQQNPGINWNILQPAPPPQPAPRPQVVYVPQPVAPTVPTATTSAVSSAFTVGSIGWFKDLCGEVRESCLTYILAVVQGGYRNNEIKLCPPAGINLGDYPRIVMANLKNNPVLHDNMQSDVGVLVSLTVQIGCKDDGNSPTTDQKSK